MQASTSQDEIDQLQRRLKNEVDDLQSSYDRLERQNKGLKGDVERFETEIRGYKDTIATSASAMTTMEATKSTLSSQIEGLTEDKRRHEITIDALTAELAKAKLYIDEMENKCREEESLRRKLHNTIQELKGNVRVFCRVRPFLGQEEEKLAAPLFDYPGLDEKEITVLQESVKFQIFFNGDVNGWVYLTFSFWLHLM